MFPRKSQIQFREHAGLVQLSHSTVRCTAERMLYKYNSNVLITEQNNFACIVILFFKTAKSKNQKQHWVLMSLNPHNHFHLDVNAI